jgi:hypothetical protein
MVWKFVWRGKRATPNFRKESCFPAWPVLLFNTDQGGKRRAGEDQEKRENDRLISHAPAFLP